MIHELKIASKYFEGVISGRKTFEVRKDDRNYRENDVLILKEYDNSSFTGNEYAVIVTYVQRDVYCKDGYCIMSVERDNFRNTLRVIRSMGYKTAVFEDNSAYTILFYKMTNEKSLIYLAYCNKRNEKFYGVDFGRVEKDFTYDEDSETKEVYLKDFSISHGCFTAISDCTEESVIKAIEVVDENVEEWGENEFEFIVYFDDAEEIIRLYGEKNNKQRIE